MGPIQSLNCEIMPQTMSILPERKASITPEDDVAKEENHVLYQVNMLMMAIGEAILAYPYIAEYCLNILAVIALYLILLRNWSNYIIP